MFRLLLISTLVFLSACQKDKDQQTVASCLGMSNEYPSFVINADDAGMHADMDKAIIELYEAGKIQSFSLMVPTNNFEHIAQYAVTNNISVGLHLTLNNEWQPANNWSPILSQKKVPSLYNPQGNMWASGEELAKHAKVEEVEFELKAQIDKALAMGLNVTHLDFHMVYWSTRDDLLELNLRIAKEYQLPIIAQLFWMSQKQQRQQIVWLAEQGVHAPDTFWMYYNPKQRSRDPRLGERLYRKMFNAAQPGLHHVAIHPALNTDAANKEMFDNAFRVDEYKLFVSDKLNEIIKNNNVQLVNHQALLHYAKKHKPCFSSQ